MNTKTSSNSSKTFVYFCNWNPYASIMSLASKKNEFPKNLSFFRFSCSSRITPAIILKAFQEGADKVLILSCGDLCHYGYSKEKILEKNLKISKDLIELLGFNSYKIQHHSLSSHDEIKFLKILEDFNKNE